MDLESLRFADHTMVHCKLASRGKPMKYSTLAAVATRFTSNLCFECISRLAIFGATRKASLWGRFVPRTFRRAPRGYVSHTSEQTSTQVV
ncbi:hypothetical protein K227x_18290 [Rubripirellula lacrimiformis]|uniref:Uncharacterized protein n=1 Tax=Rubripirellula lacrimiformis TaxID=1930273 RepID=A0A517N8I1_9BACT|nr:hypothetical protein K227x_18290 [Rubripirellula lacrimiformis]